MRKDFGPEDLAAVSSRNFLKEEKNRFARLFGLFKSQLKRLPILNDSYLNRWLPL